MRSLSTLYFSTISSSNALTRVSPTIRLGALRRNHDEGELLPASISLGGPCFLTRFRSSPRSPASVEEEHHRPGRFLIVILRQVEQVLHRDLDGSMKFRWFLPTGVTGQNPTGSEKQEDR